jgi:hypothetical protein
MSTTPDLIESLVADAAPVRRLRSPLVRTALWLLFAGLVVALLGASHGLRPDIEACLRKPMFLAGIAGSLATAALAGWAAFTVSLPDRSRLWMLLPTPALALWIGTLGYQCLTDWISVRPDGIQLGEAARCFSLVMLTSIPLWLAMLVMLRHVAHLRSPTAAIAASLAVAAIAASALSLFHNVEASAMILIWNFGIAGVVVVVGSTFWGTASRWVLPR